MGNIRGVPHRTGAWHSTGADPEICQSGVEEEKFERKMYVDTRINAYPH